MTPGHTLVLRTVPSGSLVKIATFNSGNAFGARYWTDGKQEAPMLEDRLWLQRHPITGELFWVDECEEIDREDETGKGGRYTKVAFAEEPRLDDYRRALDAPSGPILNREKERYLLMRYWWLVNDPFRRHSPEAARPADFAERLLRLRPLLTLEDPADRLMCAEIERELGEFSTLEQLLEWQFPLVYAAAVTQMKKLAKERNVDVREII